MPRRTRTHRNLRRSMSKGKKYRIKRLSMKRKARRNTNRKVRRNTNRKVRRNTNRNYISGGRGRRERRERREAQAQAAQAERERALAEEAERALSPAEKAEREWERINAIYSALPPEKKEQINKQWIKWAKTDEGIDIIKNIPDEWNKLKLVIPSDIVSKIDN